MAFVSVETAKGPRQVRVCDYCKTVCIPGGRFCSGRCAGQYREMIERRDQETEKPAR